MGALKRVDGLVVVADDAGVRLLGRGTLTAVCSALLRSWNSSARTCSNSLCSSAVGLSFMYRTRYGMTSPMSMLCVEAGQHQHLAGRPSPDRSREARLLPWALRPSGLVRLDQFLARGFPPVSGRCRSTSPFARNR